ncbi:hypothetical protein U1Q18_006893 [Sarracenia purpurea var. burkii]
MASIRDDGKRKRMAGIIDDGNHFGKRWKAVESSTQELLLQRRADCKDSWAGLWDVSSAGHISAGDSSLSTASKYKLIQVASNWATFLGD